MKTKKKDVMILAGLLISIPFVVVSMVEWIKNDIDVVAIAVMITSLIMILIAMVLHVSNMTGMES